MQIDASPIIVDATVSLDDWGKNLRLCDWSTPLAKRFIRQYCPLIKVDEWAKLANRGGIDIYETARFGLVCLVSRLMYEGVCRLHKQ